MFLVSSQSAGSIKAGRATPIKAAGNISYVSYAATVAILTYCSNIPLHCTHCINYMQALVIILLFHLSGNIARAPALAAASNINNH